MYAFLLNEHPTHTHLSNWTFGAWELGCSRALLLSSDRQEDGLAAGGGRESRRGLLRWPWRFLLGPHTLLRTSGSCRGAVAVPPAGAGLGISLRWEEPGADEDLDLAVCCWKARLGITWLMAFARFWASANRSVMDSTASPKRPEGVTGAFRSTLRSASLRSARFSQRCLWRTTIKPMALPTDWAARFDAINAKSVATRRSFVASAVRAPPSAACRSFAWKTCSTAMACNADAASPSEAYALLARWAVVLHGFEGRLMSEPRVFAAAGHRCAATVSSTGGERTYPWASAPSTWENMACVLEWTHADWGTDHVFTSCSCTSGKKGTDALESALHVDLKYHELTPDRLFWRIPGKLQLLHSLRQNPHELLLEVWRLWAA